MVTMTWRCLALIAVGSMMVSDSIDLSQESQDITLKKLLVNGRQVDCKLIYSENRYYISVEDLARALDGAVAYQKEQIVLTLGPLPNGSANAASLTVGTGRIKGNLTYYFNPNFGNKPDSGSHVWLIEGWIDITTDQSVIPTSSADSVFVMDYITRKQSSYFYKLFKHTISDGNGSFEVNDIPEGNYTLVISSNHTKGGDGVTAPKVNYRDSSHRTKIVKITVKSGDLIDKSIDFGISAF